MLVLVPVAKEAVRRAVRNSVDSCIGAMPQELSLLCYAGYNKGDDRGSGREKRKEAGWDKVRSEVK